MKYETPEVTALIPAITAIQGNHEPKPDLAKVDRGGIKESQSAYEDWEE